MTSVPKVPLAVRRWLYAVGVAVAAVAVGYGLIDGVHATLWLGLLSALTSTTALVHSGDPAPATDYEPKHATGDAPSDETA